MKFHTVVFGLAFVGSFSAGAAEPAAAPRLPFAFVENKGQIADARVRYVGNGPDYKALFHVDGITFVRGGAHSAMRFIGGSDRVRLAPSVQAPGRTNYLYGSDASRWITDLPMFDALVYEGVWPGVRMRLKGVGSEAQTEYEINSPAAVSQIRLHFDGEVHLQQDGSLLVSNATGDFRQSAPKFCQGPEFTNCSLQGQFVQGPDGSIGFTTIANVTAPVDQRILFSGYFGGTSQTTITGIAINSYYNTVVTGWTLATDLPATGGAQTHSGGGIDAFVAAFSPVGGTLIYCTYLGGSGADEASAIAVDASNNTYITGWTSSTNFPVTNAIQTRLSGPRDAFIAKLNAAGNALVYSTYLGGTGVDTGNGIKVDASGAAVIIGDTTSTNLPTTAGVVQPRLKGAQDVFIAKLTPAGTGLQVLTYFGGSAAEHGAAIALDSSGAIFICGSTYSTNLPVLNAAQPQSGGGQDAFVAKLSSYATSIVFSTYLGGSGGIAGAPESANAIVLGPSGNAIVGGTTASSNFPVIAGAFQPAFAGGQTDGFVARYSGTTGALQRCTYLGGSSDDGINAVATDLNGTAYAAGYTLSGDFPTLRAEQSSSGGQMDAFVVKMTATQMLYSSYWGGNGNDSANALATDSMTSVVIGGSSTSSDLPLAGNVGASQGAFPAGFILKIAPNFNLNLAAPPDFYFDVWHDTGYNGPNLTLNTSTFGLVGDLPVYGDWDGTGINRIGCYRNGTWFLDINGNGVLDAGDKTISFGQAGDIPIVGDWNGTGRLKLGLYRQGTFILDMSGHLTGVPTGLADQTFAFGQPSDIPVVGDWNKSGTAKVGVFRHGLWLVDFNGDQVFNGLDQTYSYGQAGDIPVVGDWDSSGTRSKIGVYRNGVWILDYDGNNAISGTGQWELYCSFGSSSYAPLIR